MSNQSAADNLLTVPDVLKALCSDTTLTARRLTYLTDGSPVVIYDDPEQSVGVAVILANNGKETASPVLAEVERKGPRYVLKNTTKTVHFKGWVFAVARVIQVDIETAEAE